MVVEMMRIQAMKGPCELTRLGHYWVVIVCGGWSLVMMKVGGRGPVEMCWSFIYFLFLLGSEIRKCRKG